MKKLTVHPNLEQNKYYYDSILKELKYIGEDKNEHTFKHMFLNAQNIKIGLSNFETIELLTLNKLN